MLEKMPGYYRKSKVMNDLIHSIENEFERLKSETTLTENQFFVILSDRDIKSHEEDVGLVPDTSADIEARRGRVLSKLRGTGTVTKTMMKNVAASFVNGDIVDVFVGGHILGVQAGYILNNPVAEQVNFTVSIS